MTMCSARLRHFNSHARLMNYWVIALFTTQSSHHRLNQWENIYIYAMLYHPIFMIQWLVQKLTTQTRFRRGENWLYKWEKIDFFLIPFRFSLNTNFLRAFTNSSENKWTNRMRRISISCSFELFWFTYYYVKNRVQMKYNLDKLIIVFVMSTQVVDNKMTRNR